MAVTDVDVSAVIEDLGMRLAEAGGQSLRYHALGDIKDWDQFMDDHDGLDSCTYYLRCVTQDDHCELYDGIDIPLEVYPDGTIHTAGWYEIDTPDMMGITDADAREWVAKV